MDIFAETRRKYQQLKISFDAGKIDKNSFQKSVEALVFTDQKGNTWQIGVSSGDWYRLQGNEWVKDYPPPQEIQNTPSESELEIPDDFGTEPPPPPPDYGDGSPEPPKPDYGDGPPGPPKPDYGDGSSPPPPPPSSVAEPPAPVYTLPDSDKEKKPKKKRKGCLIIGAIILVVAACLAGALFIGSKVINDGDTLNDFEPSFLGGNQNSTYMDVENNSQIDICGIYISPSTSDDWGPNWLSSGEILSPGDYVRYEVTIGETLDIYAEDCQGNTIDTLYEIDIPEEGVTITYSPD